MIESLSCQGRLSIPRDYLAINGKEIILPDLQPLRCGGRRSRRGMRAAVNFGSAPKAGFEGGGASWNNSGSAALSLRRVPTREVSPKTHPKARKYSSRVAGGQQQEMAQGFPRQLCPDYRRVDLGTELGGMLFRAPDGRRTRLLKRRFFRAVKSGPGIYRQGFSGSQARSGQRFCRGHQPGELH